MFGISNLTGTTMMDDRMPSSPMPLIEYVLSCACSGSGSALINVGNSASAYSLVNPSVSTAPHWQAPLISKHDGEKGSRVATLTTPSGTGTSY